ncbi:MAG: hypothetical protein M0R03_19705 [Novosphingobium sp.]|nr:hypothetical protein [Novosphingobium sp.]
MKGILKMKKILLSLITASALISLTSDMKASFSGMLGSAYSTVSGVVAGSINTGVEAVGIVIPGIDRESREMARHMSHCCCCHN